MRETNALLFPERLGTKAGWQPRCCQAEREEAHAGAGFCEGAALNIGEDTLKGSRFRSPSHPRQVHRTGLRPALFHEVPCLIHREWTCGLHMFVQLNEHTQFTFAQMANLQPLRV